MNILLVNNGTKHLQALQQLFQGHTIETVGHDGVPSNTDSFELIVLSGGRKHAVKTHTKYYQPEIDLIKSAKIPILGICLGCELIAHAYGAELSRITPQHNPNLEIEILVPDNSLFNGIDNLQVYEAHRWVISQLPRELVGLAKSINGYEIIQHTTKPIVGFQFHPEMCTNEVMRDVLLANLLRIFS